MMRNSIRCCISCILPCGALDVIRIVHSNGRVEEISGTIKASDVMKAHPKHVLKKPCSPSSSSTSEEHGGVGVGVGGGGGGGGVPKIVIVPPDAELQRGKIYFLMPLPPTPPEENQDNNKKNKNMQRKKRTREERGERRNKNSNISVTTRLVVSDGYLNDILWEKLSTQRDRRRGRVAVWRPHLESISESPSDL